MPTETSCSPVQVSDLESIRTLVQNVPVLTIPPEIAKTPGGVEFFVRELYARVEALGGKIQAPEGEGREAAEQMIELRVRMEVVAAQIAREALENARVVRENTSFALEPPDEIDSPARLVAFVRRLAERTEGLDLGLSQDHWTRTAADRAISFRAGVAAAIAQVEAEERVHSEQAARAAHARARRGYVPEEDLAKAVMRVAHDEDGAVKSVTAIELQLRRAGTETSRARVGRIMARLGLLRGAARYPQQR